MGVFSVFLNKLLFGNVLGYFTYRIVTAGITAHLLKIIIKKRH